MFLDDVHTSPLVSTHFRHRLMEYTIMCYCKIPINICKCINRRSKRILSVALNSRDMHNKPVLVRGSCYGTSFNPRVWWQKMSDMMMKMIAFFAANTFLNEKQPPLVWFLPACWLCDCVAFSTAPASLYIRFLRAYVCECAFASVWAQHTCIRTHDDDAARNDARDREVSQLWARASHLFANV